MILGSSRCAVARTITVGACFGLLLIVPHVRRAEGALIDGIARVGERARETTTGLKPGIFAAPGAALEGPLFHEGFRRSQWFHQSPSYAQVVSSSLWIARSSVGDFMGTPTNRPRRASSVSTQRI